MAVAELTIRSSVLDMDVKVNVIMPEERQTYQRIEGKKYPVLYILHGYKEDNSSWLNLSNIYLNTRDLDLFVVMPSTYDGFYMDTKFGFKYQTFISEELPIRLKNYFPISDKREDTFIMGESMGGFGTLYTSLMHPENYGKAIVLSGGPFSYGMRKDDRLEYIFGTQEEFEKSDANLYNLAKKVNDSSLAKPEFTFYCGTEDFGCENVKKFTQFLKDECPNIQFTEEYWSGKHDFYFWNQAVPKALKQLGFDADPNKTKQI